MKEVNPIAKLGSMLAAERNQVFTAPHLVFFPGLAIMITVLAFNLLGDGLRDALDPRLAQSDLKGLSSADAGDLIRALARFDVNENTARLLFERSGGNPLFLEHLIHRLNDSASPEARESTI